MIIIEQNMKIDSILGFLILNQRELKNSTETFQVDNQSNIRVDPIKNMRFI